MLIIIRNITCQCNLLQVFYFISNHTLLNNLPFIRQVVVTLENYDDFYLLLTVMNVVC